MKLSLLEQFMLHRPDEVRFLLGRSGTLLRNCLRRAPSRKAGDEFVVEAEIEGARVADDTGKRSYSDHDTRESARFLNSMRSWSASSLCVLLCRSKGKCRCTALEECGKKLFEKQYVERRY
jgi:hypothetical protein